MRETASGTSGGKDRKSHNSGQRLRSLELKHKLREAPYYHGVLPHRSVEALLSRRGVSENTFLIHAHPTSSSLDLALALRRDDQILYLPLKLDQYGVHADKRVFSSVFALIAFFRRSPLTIGSSTGCLSGFLPPSASVKE